jgi:hypothetical protein
MAREEYSAVHPMEEPGEQSIIVFALIVTEPARECVCVCGGGTSSVTIYVKTTVHCSPDPSMVHPLCRTSTTIARTQSPPFHSRSADY